MKKQFLLLLVFMVTTAGAFACINLYTVSNDGAKHTIDGILAPHLVSPFSWHHDTGNYARLDSIIKNPGIKEFRYVSDYGALLAKYGRLAESEIIFNKLLAKHPREYAVIANMAVVYELQGKPEEALECLKESLMLNDNSHFQSEWVHQQILEEKVRLLRAGAGAAAGRILHPDLNKESVWLAQQLGVQLQERVPLTASPDVLMSRVLEETGHYMQTASSVQSATYLYAIAIGYSRDSVRNKILWEKLRQCRNQFIEYRGKDAARFDAVLAKRDWQDSIKRLIRKWENFQPEKYMGDVVTVFESN